MASGDCHHWIERGAAALHQQRPSEAAAALASALEIEPDNAEALSLYGLALLRMGDAETSRTALTRAVALEPREVGFHVNLAEWYAAAAQPDLAAAEIRIGLAHDAERPRAWDRLGDLLVRCGDWNGAADAYRNRLERDPGNPAAFGKLAHALTVLRAWQHLEAVASAWTRAAPSSPEAWRTLANAYYERGLHGPARRAHDRAVRHSPNDVNTLCAAARFRLQVHDLVGAGELLDRAEALDASHPSLVLTRASRLAALGRFDEAERACRAAIAGAPRMVPAYSLLAQLNGGQFDEVQLDTLQCAADDLSTPLEWRIRAHSSVADSAHARGEYQAAFARLTNAHALVRELAEAEGLRYEATVIERRIEKIRLLFSDPLPASTGQRHDTCPIFLVGLPGSGLGLIDAVLSTHPQVTSAGEYPVMAQSLVEYIAREREREPIDASVIARWIGTYLQGLPGAARGRFVVDRNPLNVEAVGLIAQLFPTSPIISVRRNALAAGFDVYRRDFRKFSTFAHGLDTLGHYYTARARLIGHWEHLLGPRLSTLQYEDFLSGLPATVADLLDACGLTYHQDCENFRIGSYAIDEWPRDSDPEAPSQDHDAYSHYLELLTPLRNALTTAGIEIVTGVAARS